MSNENRRYGDDFKDLDPREADELAEVADLLRADRFEPESENYWSALQQRIVNEVEVTPLPRRAGAEQSSWWRRVTRALQGSRLRPAVAGGSAIAAVALVLWAVGRAPEEPSRELPDVPVATHDDDEPVEPLVVPDDLWSDGFLVHQMGGVNEVSWDDDSDDEYLASYEEEYDDDELDEDEDDYAFSYGLGSQWGLDDLSDDELLELESMLEG